MRDLRYDDIRKALAELHQSQDALIYSQIVNLIELMYENAKEQVLVESEQRDVMVGIALAYRRLLKDLTNPVQ